MICSKCKEDKELSNFILKKNNRYDSWCNDCHKQKTTEFKQTIIGLIGEIYNAQKVNSKKRKHNPPSYTKKELENYLLSNPTYINIYTNWVNNDYDKDLRPSIDRLDDFKGYSFNNIQIITVSQNREKQYNDIRLGISTSGERCKKVLMIKDNKVICEFISASEAARLSNGSQGHISACCRGERKSHKGFNWKFKNEN